MHDSTSEILLVLAAGAHARRRIRFRGAELELEVIDILRADDETLARLRQQLTTVMLAAYTTAPQALQAGTASGPGEYLDRVLDRSIFGVYNTIVLVHSGERPVAFTGGHVCKQNVLEQEVEVVRIGVHVAAGHQAQGLSGLTFAVNALRYARTRLFVSTPRYFLGLCANPVSYAFVHRRARRVHPSPVRPGDAVMRALCEHGFPGEQRCGQLIAMPLAARLDERLREYVTTTDDPAVRFYLAQNPNFEQGYVLPMVVELGPADFAYAMGVHGWFAAQKLSRRLRRAA